MKWVHIGEEIEYDWYELQCQLSQKNHLQIFLEGLKNQKLKYCIGFGKILFCRSIDEGWDLNLLEEDLLSGPEIPYLSGPPYHGCLPRGRRQLPRHGEL